MPMKDKNNLYTAKDLAKSYLVVFLAALLLYIVSCAPGVLWQDSGMYQYRIWQNDIEGGLGLALSHPLYHIIGIGVKSIPLGEFAHRVNLISAFAAAFTIANLFLLLRIWLDKILPSIIAAITLALSHTMWLHASIAEVYTLYTALFTAELVFLLLYLKSRRIGYLYLLGLINGLAIANHMWAVIALASYLVFLTALLIQKKINLKHCGIIAGLWIIGAGPYEYLIIKNIIETGDFTVTISSAFFGKNWQGDVLNTSVSAQIIKENFILIAYNFPTPNIIFFFVGLYGLKKVSPVRSFTAVLLAMSVLFFIFAFRYSVPDRYAFFMPFYCLAAIFIGLGTDTFLKRYPQKLYAFFILFLTLLPLAVFKFTPIVAENREISLGTKRSIPYRNDYVWFLQPWKTGYKGPEQFAKEALNGAEKEAIIIADGTTVYPLWYVQEVKGIRKDVKIISMHGSYESPIPFPTSDTIDKLTAERAIYVVSNTAGYYPNFLLQEYQLEKRGILWKVVK